LHLVYKLGPQGLDRANRGRVIGISRNDNLPVGPGYERAQRAAGFPGQVVSAVRRQDLEAGVAHVLGNVPDVTDFKRNVPHPLAVGILDLKPIDRHAALRVIGWNGFFQKQRDAVEGQWRRGDKLDIVYGFDHTPNSILTVTAYNRQ
jgi:hypothetical protein